MAQNGQSHANDNGQRGQNLQRVHERMHASHPPNPDAEAAPGGDQGVPFGSLRVEEGRYRNADGTVDSGEVNAQTGEVIRPERRAWKLYEFREIGDDQRDTFTAKMDVAGWKVGEQTVRGKWELVSQHDTEQEALDAVNRP